MVETSELVAAMSRHQIPPGSDEKLILGYFGVRLGWVPIYNRLNDTRVNQCVFSAALKLLLCKVEFLGISHF